MSQEYEQARARAREIAGSIPSIPLDNVTASALVILAASILGPDAESELIALVQLQTVRMRSGQDVTEAPKSPGPERYCRVCGTAPCRVRIHIPLRME